MTLSQHRRRHRKRKSAARFSIRSAKGSSVSPEYVARAALQALSSRNDRSGRFAVIEADRIRLRPLPSKETP